GAVLATETVRIGPLDTAGILTGRLAEAGARLLPTTLAALAAGTAVATPQAVEGVTYAKKVKTAEARIDWSRSARELDIRGLSPFPGAWFEAPSAKGPLRVKALLSRAEDATGAPGEVLDDALLIACGEGAIRLLRAQREGRSAQDADEFVRGFPLAAGTVLA
ncbi:MAG TPA: methionyl-tRNA formyltransferase, partial [Caulobacter sp.]|nr:methionyl-tRNA formyltransferase [Caulobacter sp.]